MVPDLICARHVATKKRLITKILHNALAMSGTGISNLFCISTIFSFRSPAWARARACDLAVFTETAISLELDGGGQLLPIFSIYAIFMRYRVLLYGTREWRKFY